MITVGQLFFLLQFSFSVQYLDINIAFDVHLIHNSAFNADPLFYDDSLTSISESWDVTIEWIQFAEGRKISNHCVAILQSQSRD